MTSDINDFMLNLLCIQDCLGQQMDQKSQEIGRLEAQAQKAKQDVEKAEQVNNDLKGKILNKDLEIESVQVSIKSIGYI